MENNFPVSDVIFVKNKGLELVVKLVLRVGGDVVGNKTQSMSKHPIIKTFSVKASKGKTYH